jgi:hypothetical protein
LVLISVLNSLSCQNRGTGATRKVLLSGFRTQGRAITCSH